MAPELRELILNRAAGNPLFMEELTHTLLENGSIQKTGRSIRPDPKALGHPGPRHHPGDHRRPDGPSGGEPETDHAGGLGHRPGVRLPHPADHHRHAGGPEDPSS